MLQGLLRETLSMQANPRLDTAQSTCRSKRLRDASQQGDDAEGPWRNRSFAGDQGAGLAAPIAKRYPSLVTSLGLDRSRQLQDPAPRRSIPAIAHRVAA